MIGGIIMFMDFLLIFGIKDHKPKKHRPIAKPSDDESIVKEKK